MKKCILMLGLPEPLLNSLSAQSKAFGYQVLPAFSLGIAGWLAAQRRFALIVINMEHFQTGLPEFLSKVREHQYAPAIALSDTMFSAERRRTSNIDCSLSIQLHPRKMMAYFMAMMRQSQGYVDFTEAKPFDGWPIEQGDFFVDQILNWVSVGEKMADLSPKECQLLVYFLLHSGQTLHFQTVCTALWMDMGGYGCDESVIVDELRNKIEPDPTHPVYLQDTSLGYRFYDTVL